MRLDLDIFKIDTKKLVPVKGRALIAEPILPDVVFSRSVVLICNVEGSGHSGLILNKPAGIKLDQVLPEAENSDFDVFLGGPVETERLFYLHKYGDIISNSMQIKENLWWGGDFDSLSELLKAGVLEKSKISFFLGYSGWTEGQLSDELRNNSWLVADIPENFVFSDSAAQWSNSLSYVDEKYSIWRNFPEDPEMN